MAIFCQATNWLRPENMWKPISDDNWFQLAVAVWVQFVTLCGDFFGYIRGVLKLAAYYWQSQVTIQPVADWMSQSHS